MGEKKKITKFISLKNIPSLIKLLFRIIIPAEYILSYIKQRLQIKIALWMLLGPIFFFYKPQSFI